MWLALPLFDALRVKARTRSPSEGLHRGGLRFQPPPEVLYLGQRSPQVPVWDRWGCRGMGRV